jgi:hypothetical protein
MSERASHKNMKCREARRHFSVLLNNPSDLDNTEDRRLLERHLSECGKCEREYSLFSLGRTVLDMAASNESVSPDKDFFVALRARIARGPDERTAPRPTQAPDESWAAALALTTRQLIPAMAILLALIVSATFIWGNNQTDYTEVAVRPSERVVFGDMYEYPRPTTDDVLETLVAVEELENGR